MRSIARLSLVFALLGARPAAAHIQLMSPPARTASQKAGPCGEADSVRGDVVSTFRPGDSITVTWEEVVDHPGHFRIAFDADGQDDFFVPAGFEDVSGGPGVLRDGIEDRDGGIYSEVVELPDVECDRCTLQVIQVMADKAPYGDGNDLYYQCADLVLSLDAEPAPATTEPIEDDVDDEGCACNGSGGGAAGLIVPLIVWARRRRSG